MSAPLCSYEVPGLVRLAIAASRALNARFDLPADKDSVRLTWKEVETCMSRFLNCILILAFCICEYVDYNHKPG